MGSAGSRFTAASPGACTRSGTTRRPRWRSMRQRRHTAASRKTTSGRRSWRSTRTSKRWTQASADLSQEQRRPRFRGEISPSSYEDSVPGLLDSMLESDSYGPGHLCRLAGAGRTCCRLRVLLLARQRETAARRPGRRNHRSSSVARDGSCAGASSLSDSCESAHPFAGEQRERRP